MLLYSRLLVYRIIWEVIDVMKDNRDDSRIKHADELYQQGKYEAIDLVNQLCALKKSLAKKCRVCQCIEQLRRNLSSYTQL